jgi:death-on-curing protein
LDAEPLWLTFEHVSEIHDDQLARYGGLAGVMDDNLIHSALAAPLNLYHYDMVDDVLALAIRLCFALAKNHGYVDGNKRTAAVAMLEFLITNGFTLVIPDDEPESPLLGEWVEKLVTGALNEHQLYERLVHFVELLPEE